MTWLAHRLRLPASESQMAVVLALSLLAMSLMLCAILWQSTVIAQQGEVIRWLNQIKFGG
jgi:hypothetical protein